MRRFLSWFLPLMSGMACAIILAWGFVLGVRGGVGEPVTDVPPPLPERAVGTGPLRVLVLGDSVARGTGDVSGLGIGGALAAELDAEHREHAPIVNLAVDGARTANLLQKLESPSLRRLAAETDVIVVSIGGNDLHGESRQGPAPDADKAMEEVLGRVKEIGGVLREASPRGRIFFIGLYNPFQALPEGKVIGVAVRRWNARLVESFADDPGVTVVQTSDLFVTHDRLGPDRFHPGKEAYRIIGRRIAESI